VIPAGLGFAPLTPREILRRMAIPPAAFAAAADLVLGQPARDPAGAAVLAALCPEGPPPGGWRDPADLAALLRAAAGFLRVFALPVPGDPPLAAFGAELDLGGALGPGPAGVSGIAASRLGAFRACIGEGVELLAQCETAADRARYRRLPPSAALPLPPGLPPVAGPIDWLPVGETLLPADLCLRRPPAQRDLTPPWPLSIGCAAGRDAAAARLRAILELLERDAVALWWRGGRRGRPMHHPAPPGTGLLDLTTDLTEGLPVSVVAAWSCGPDGRGFCCGTAARTTPEDAAAAALLELRQMQLAIAVVAAKREQRGAEALNDRDRAHLARYHGIRADCPLLAPSGAPRPPAPAVPAGGAEALLRAGLAGRGMAVEMLDLTRADPGIPVWRALCLGLEMEPGRPPGPRLQAAIAMAGGADSLTQGVPLL
jgi:ribosomal protein S12 methylthiotransferase accessory factor